MTKLAVSGDMISDLPEAIKCHIISLLETKDAVFTTMLSTKWKNLWTTAIKDIVLDDSLFNCRTEDDNAEDKFIASLMYTTGEVYELESNNARRFAGFVNTVIRFHDVPDTKTFSLHCLTKGCSYDVYSWVEKAISKKIEELDLHLEYHANDPIPVPSSVFTCETLRVLKLEGPIFAEVPNTCYLPRLQELMLKLVHYRNDESVHNLISSCSSLESLNISRDTFDGVKTFTVSSSSLKDLRIDRTFSDSRFHKSRYVINAPALQHLELCNAPPTELYIDNLPSLVRADVSLLWSGLSKSLYADDVSKLLQVICNSQVLNVSGDTFKAIVLVYLFPKFDRLSELKVEMKCCNWNPLQKFIINSDRLEVLLLRKISCKKKAHELRTTWNTWRNPDTVPLCLLSSLKRMVFFGFVGEKAELTMVEYILKNAMVMQEMEIHFGPSLQKPATLLHKELSEFSVGSVKCQVTIS